MIQPLSARIEAERDAVNVTGTALQERVPRLFFASILGATPIENGWRCPRRSLSLSTLVVRINTYLETRGWNVQRIGIADEAVQREIERKRSFRRAQTAGIALRKGEPAFDSEALRGALAKVGWNIRDRDLLPHQTAGAIHALSTVNAANFSVPGAGKTLTTLAVALTHIVNQTIDVVLVIGPLSCFRPWEKEVRTAVGEYLKTKRVRGSSAHRRTTYSTAGSKQLLLASYASAAADRAAIIDLCRRMNVLLIVDESHRIKRFRGGLWAPALMDIARHARVRITLSGTPMPQSGKDLYSQLRVLWPDGDLTGAPDDFAQRVSNNFDTVLNDVRPFVSRTPKEALNLDPYTIVSHDVALSGTQQEVYQLIAEQFRRLLEDASTWRDKLEALRRGRPIRLLQAACNPDLLNHKDSQYHLPQLAVPNPTLMQRLAAFRGTAIPAKSQKALELIRDIGKANGKVVCWSNFVGNLDQLTELIRKETGYPTFQIDGRIPTGDDPSDDKFGAAGASGNQSVAETRELIIERFLGCDGPSILVTNPASTSESISLHSTCHNAIYLDRTYDCALFLQSIDRIHRLGLPRGVQVTIHLLKATSDGRETIDHLVDQSLRSKEAAMRLLLEGAELRALHTPENPADAADGDEQDLRDLLRYLLGEQLK
ncbi:MAG TPA: DEAD/DEAH box helicase [Candidatus Angelobacter sp.]|nr:DEAD/DEAH box helicase [Candidatus Angelobacter sp.]